MEKNIDITAMGELLIDFTQAGNSQTGMRLFEQNPGGAPANMLAAAGKMGMKTAFIGKVGNDIHGRFLKETLNNSGIETTGLIFSDNIYTTMAFVSLSEDGEREFSFNRNGTADTQLSMKEIDSDLIKQTKVFHVGSLSLTDEPSRTATYESIKVAKEYGAIISYDPNYRAPLWENLDVAKERMQSIIRYTDIMKLSDEEVALLTPYSDYKEAAAYLLESGVKIVAVTLGAKGAYMASKNWTGIVKGYKSSQVDSTGAGDSFWGAAVSRIIKKDVTINNANESLLREMAIYGNAMASIVVERRGAIAIIPNQCEVERRIGLK